MDNKRIAFYELGTTIIFGYNRINDDYVFIDDCENGLRCGLVCRFCGNPLNAKNHCVDKTNHFAHKAGSDCKQGHESTIPLLMRRVLKETKKIQLPTCYHSRDRSIYQDYELLDIKNIDLEKYDEDYSYNVIIETTNSKRVAIIPFIKSTSLLTREKEAKDKYEYVLTINFSGYKDSEQIVEDVIRDMVLSGRYNGTTKWISNKDSKSLEEKYNLKVEEKEATLKAEKEEIARKKHNEIIKPVVVGNVTYYRLRAIEEIGKNKKTIRIKHRFYPKIMYLINFEKPFKADNGHLLGRRIDEYGRIADNLEEINYLSDSFWFEF